VSAASKTLRAPAATRRGNLGLAVLALVQLALLVLVLLTVARPPKTSTGPLLGKDVTVANVTAFTVTGSDGSSVTLRRDGTNWVLPDQGGYPAQSARVKSFLQQLVGLQRSGLVATTADAYKRLKVTKDTYQKKVDLTLKGGGSKTLLIGSEPSYGSTHVRLASDKGVYVTHALHASDARTDPSGYVDATVLSLDQANLTRMEVRNAAGDLVFTHAKSGWSLKGLPSGKKLDTQAVGNLAASLTSLQLNEPLGKTVKPAYGFDKPLAVVTLTTVRPAKKTGSSGSGANASSANASSTNASSANASSANGSSANASSANASSANGSGTNASNAGSTSAGAAQPASKPAAATPAKTTTTTITVGAKDKGGFYPVRVSGSPYVVRVSSSALGGVVGKTQADFIAKPAPNGGGSGAAGGGSTGALQRLTAPPPGSAGGAAGGGTSTH